MLFFPIIIQNAIQAVPYMEQSVLPLDHESLIALGGSTMPQDEGNEVNKTNPTSAELVAFLTQIFGERLMPHFYQIARCESTLRQWNDDGTVVHSVTDDWGVLQINGIWLDKSRQMGLNILDSWKDNVRMAKYVFDNQSATAWTCSKKI